MFVGGSGTSPLSASLVSALSGLVVGPEGWSCGGSLCPAGASGRPAAVVVGGAVELALVEVEVVPCYSSSFVAS